MNRAMTVVAMALLCVACAAPKTSGAPPAAAAAPMMHHHHHHADEQAGDAPAAFDRLPAPGTLARCAVSGEVFTVAADTTYSEFQGKTYVFCCGGCKTRFDAAPDKFAAR
jgi:YHS domain-containing protein